MKIWQEDQLHAIHTVECEHKLFKIIVSHARKIGFDYCAYGLRMPLPLTEPKIKMFNNYPVEWQRQYQNENYVAIDPTVQHCMHSQLPIIWSNNLITRAQEFWEEAHSFGLHTGWAQSSRDIHGFNGMLTLARSSNSLTVSELRDNTAQMAWLTQLTHQGMSRILAVKMIPELDVKLSIREIEVLRWTGDGKTSAEVADILNISERTVNFHVTNAMNKLNTPNKTAAVIRAAMLGML